MGAHTSGRAKERQVLGGGGRDTTGTRFNPQQVTQRIIV